MTRPSGRAYATCSSSLAVMSPASDVVVTSTPRRLKPRAIARWQFSSRWNRIVRGIGLPSLEHLLQAGRPRLGPHLLGEPLAFLDGRVNLLAVLVVVGQGPVD